VTEVRQASSRCQADVPGSDDGDTIGRGHCHARISATAAPRGRESGLRVIVTVIKTDLASLEGGNRLLADLP
jgi:hypothetical protein